MMNPDKAKQLILEHTTLNETTLIPLEQAKGLVLAENIVATCSVPAFDNSAMDGYAVRIEDLEQVNREHPVLLRKADFVSAGMHETRTLNAGECYQIATGAEIPPGVDTVVMQESVTVEGDSVKFTRLPKKKGKMCVIKGKTFLKMKLFWNLELYCLLHKLHYWQPLVMRRLRSINL